MTKNVKLTLKKRKLNAQINKIEKNGKNKLEND